VLSMLCGSRVLSTMAQVLSRTERSAESKVQWLGDGEKYSQWLARNISVCATSLKPDQTVLWHLLSQATKRAMSLGYRGKQDQLSEVSSC
jgi:hypothetical protein